MGASSATEHLKWQQISICRSQTLTQSNFVNGFKEFQTEASQFDLQMLFCGMSSRIKFAWNTFRRSLEVSELIEPDNTLRLWFQRDL